MTAKKKAELERYGFRLIYEQASYAKWRKKVKELYRVELIWIPPPVHEAEGVESYIWGAWFRKSDGSKFQVALSGEEDPAKALVFFLDVYRCMGCDPRPDPHE